MKYSSMSQCPSEGSPVPTSHVLFSAESAVRQANTAITGPKVTGVKTPAFYDILQYSLWCREPTEPQMNQEY